MAAQYLIPGYGYYNDAEAASEEYLIPGYGYWNEQAAAGGGPDTPQGLHWLGDGFNPQRSTKLGGELQ